MANLALTGERKAFSVAIDAALKSLNKDREKGLLQIVDLTEKFMGDNFRDRKSTRLNSSHITRSRMPSSA